MFTVLAVACGDAVQLADPESLWWQELRVLLKYRRSVADELLDAWAGRLALITRAGHRIPAHSIRRWMRTWKSDLTVEDVLNFRESDT